jgi:hypothetical protein
MLSRDIMCGCWKTNKRACSFLGPALQYTRGNEWAESKTGCGQVCKWKKPESAGKPEQADVSRQQQLRPARRIRVEYREALEKPAKS